MATPNNVELEAAKFLHKLIQDSKDEPTKLATKLYVILQHMRSSGKENSMPYQVISRAMETVIKQHGLDIEALMSSRHPLAPPGAQLGESGSSQVVGSLQRTGASKDQKVNLTANEASKPDSYPSGMSHTGPSSGHDASNMTGGAGKSLGLIPGAASSYPSGETGVSAPMQFASSSYDNLGFAGKMYKEGIEAFPVSTPSMDPYTSKTLAGRTVDQEGGANLLPNSNKLNQAGIPSNIPETSMSRNAAPRDPGKAPFAQAPVSGLPFKEHHLKQLRAQCLVFLAFRNGLMPKKLHLEIALGNFFPKEEGARREMNDHKGKDQSVHELHNMPEVSRPTTGLDTTRGVDKLTSGTSSGTHLEANFSQGPENPPSLKEDKSNHHAVPYEHSDERRLNLAVRRKPETDIGRQERLESQLSSIRGMHLISSREDDSGNNQQQPVMLHPGSFISGASKHMKPEMTNWPGNSCQPEASKVSVPTSGLTQESLLQKEIAPSQSQSPADGNSLGHRHTDNKLPSLPLREQWKSIPGVDGHNVLLMPTKDNDILVRNVLPVQEPDMDDEDTSAATGLPSSPKYTTFEKWILERQKRKLLTEKNWAMKHQKTEQKKIAVCSAKLKESVTSSEDINAKTKSVIELKKLKLLDLQRHLRSDILNDFFKPIASEMDRLKSIKKHRIGRRSKQLERYEQKMKEERQKRIRERQKEFFSEVEVHREKLEDVFKMKRERWKGFNKYVREFHKRKERIHREKIDRIQREKINLLKINDVEGYLRMVQDAKSDRVKQLLKETEKYLQKLGSKLQDAKNTARRFETDVDDYKTNTMVEKNEISFENDDEADQAKHYLESNEKYYMMAHSVKETVLEQPTMLLGGKLREYQMNGLRWLVSLYNNHLNGILADEMGLGKTVQVISLLCYLMETKNDRGPFLVVVPSSVLPGWESEISFWAPGMQKIVYSGPPEERRRLFKEQIIHQKFNVLLTTYEYLMNKHDRPKLSKVQWHYIIIDEGHRIKNASCKLNADLKHYRSNHRLLLTGTPLQNNLEELWALLNFLLPNIFNSSEDFSQWFNKPFESNGDSSPDEALLSEEENLLIINRLHQVLRPFVLRRLKHKVENELPEKIERLIRCEASAYQKLLMKRVEDNLGAIGSSKARSVHNSVMELRNICNHPYLSQLHVEEVHEWIPQHYLPNMIRLCGKLEMLDRLLPKLKATDHRVLLFSTMTRLLDVMEDYLCWKQYKYLRLDGHTSGGDRGALIDQFNQPGSPFFIFLLSIRAGGVGVNLQAADTVIIFDTDWNPQVDLQAQARAHRIGQKKDVLVLRLETVQTVEEQVRASAEHKLGVANQSITAGFFDNNTSAEDRREYLESLLRECKKEEAAPVLDDDALNDIIARSESEIDVFETIDKKRREEEMGAWIKLVKGNGSGNSECLPPLPPRLLMDDDLKAFYEAMKISEVPQQPVASNGGMKRKSDSLGGLDTRQYGRGKRAREVRSYEEQLTEEEFEKLCQVDSPESPQVKEEITEKKLSFVMSDMTALSGEIQEAKVLPLPPNCSVELPSVPSKEVAPLPVQIKEVAPLPVQSKEVTPPSKRGRGRPRRTPTTDLSPSPGVHQLSSGAEQRSALPVMENVTLSQVPVADIMPTSTLTDNISGNIQQIGLGPLPGSQSASLPPVPAFQAPALPGPSLPVRGRGRGRKAQSGGEPPRRRGKRQSNAVLSPAPIGISIDFETKGEAASNSSEVCNPDPVSQHSDVHNTTVKSDSISQITLLSSSTTVKSDVGPQEAQLSSQPMLPAPDAFAGPLGSQEVSIPNQSMLSASDSSGSLVTSGVSNFSLTPAPAPFPGSLVVPGVNPDPIVTSSPCPNPASSHAFPSVVCVSQSTALADSAPKQGRGRGRKAQSGVEAPVRRGKRQNPEGPATFEASTDQVPKVLDVPEKKPRVTGGRRPTRRNKQEDDSLKQSTILQSVASQSITNPAITQVSDRRSADEAGKSRTTILLDGSKKIPESSVFDDKQENEARESTNVVQTEASKSIEVSTVEGNKVHETNEARESTNVVQTEASKSIEASTVEGNKVHETNGSQKQTSDIESNPSEDINCLPVGKIPDSKSGNEDSRQMNNLDSDFSEVLANSAIPEESRADMDTGTQNLKEFKQLDQAVVIKDSSFTRVSDSSHEEETQKQINFIQSDPSPFMPDIGPTQASEVEQGVVSKPDGCADSDASQRNSDSSWEKVESEAGKQININNMDALHCVPDPSGVIVKKNLLEVQDVQEVEGQKETDVQLDMNAEISESLPMVEHADNKESDAQVMNNVVESGRPSNNVDTSVGEIQDVGQEREAQREADLSGISVVTSGSVAASEPAYKGGDAETLNDLMESDANKVMVDPLIGEIRDVDQEIEAQKETDVQLHPTVVISESVPAVENEISGGSTHALNIGIAHNTGDSLVCELQNVDLENEFQKETDVQSDGSATVSGPDALLEHVDDKYQAESSGKVQNSSVDIHLPSSSAVTPVYDILHGRTTDDHPRNEEVANKEPGASCVSTLPTEDNTVGILNVASTDFNTVSVEEDVMKVESKETAVKDFLASESQLHTNSLSEENSYSALEIVQSAIKGSDSSVCKPENQSREEQIERKCIVDGTLVSGSGLTGNSNINEECGDDSVLPHSRSDITLLSKQSYEGEALASALSFVSVISKVETQLSENLTGDDGLEEAEQKGYFDGSKTSELLDVGATAPDSEERSDGLCDKMAAEEYENNDKIQSQDMSVLCIDENLSSVSEHAPCKLEDIHEKGDADAPESKATALSEVPVLKQLTVIQNSEEIPPPTWGTREQVAEQLDIISKTDNKAWEEHADHGENINLSVESLVQELEVTEASSEEMPPPTLGTMEPEVQQLDTTSKTDDKVWEEHAERQENINQSVESLLHKLEVTEVVSSEKADAEELNNKLSENLAGKDGLEEAEQKGYVDESKISEVLNEDATAFDSEQRFDGHCDKMAAEEHEDSKTVHSEDSVSVLCIDENVCSVPEHTPFKLEDCHEKKDLDDSESKATSLNHVPVLKELTVIQSSEKMPPPTLGPMEQVVQQSDTLSETDNKSWEEHSDSQENINLSAECLVPKLEINDTSSVLKQLTVIQSSEEMPPTSLETMEQVVQQLDTTSKTDNKAWEEHGDCQENINQSVESLVQQLEVTEVSSGKADAEELKNENNLVLTHALDDSQRLGEITASTCSVLETEASLAVSPIEGFQFGEDDTTSKDVDEENNSSLQILNVNDSHVGVQEESVNQHGDGFSIELENRNADVVSNAEASCECDKVLEDTISNAVTKGMRPSASNEKTEIELDVEGRTVPNTEATAESFKVFEETFVSNAEINETRAGFKDGKSEEVDDSRSIRDRKSEEVDDSKSICEEASSSLQMASLDVTPSEVVVEDSAVEAQRSKEVETEKPVASDPKVHEPQPSVTAGTSQSKNGLQQLVEQYSDTTTDVDTSIDDSVSTVDLRNDPSPKASQNSDTSAFPASIDS